MLFLTLDTVINVRDLIIYINLYACLLGPQKLCAKEVCQASELARLVESEETFFCMPQTTVPITSDINANYRPLQLSLTCAEQNDVCAGRDACPSLSIATINRVRLCDAQTSVNKERRVHHVRYSPPKRATVNKPNPHPSRRVATH